MVCVTFRITKLIPAIRNLPYSNRILYLNIKSLQHRWLYLDLVLMYKIVHGFSAVKPNDFCISPLSNRYTRSYGTGFIACAPISSLSVFNLLTGHTNQGIRYRKKF